MSFSTFTDIGLNKNMYNELIHAEYLADLDAEAYFFLFF